MLTIHLIISGLLDWLREIEGDKSESTLTMFGQCSGKG